MREVIGEDVEFESLFDVLEVTIALVAAAQLGDCCVRKVSGGAEITTTTKRLLKSNRKSRQHGRTIHI